MCGVGGSCIPLICIMHQLDHSRQHTNSSRQRMHFMYVETGQVIGLAIDFVTRTDWHSQSPQIYP